MSSWYNHYRIEILNGQGKVIKEMPFTGTEDEVAAERDKIRRRFQPGSSKSIRIR